MKILTTVIAVLLLMQSTARAEEASRVISRSETSPARPNILFIVSDDHGWGDLPSNWDKTEVQMPTLDALAAGGVRFPNYHTEPLCGPSRACMFTGQYSMENGMWRGPGKQPLGSPGYRGIKRDVKMLSEHLAEAGYKTGAFGKWHMGSLEGEVPNDRGFDEFRGFLGGAHSYWITEGRSKILHNREPDHLQGARDRVVHSGGRKSSFERTPPRMNLSSATWPTTRCTVRFAPMNRSRPSAPDGLGEKGAGPRCQFPAQRLCRHSRTHGSQHRPVGRPVG